jgi:hypothetical protein
VKAVQGCELIETRGLFSKDEVHVRFRFSGKHFLVWEQFGDNSRLWVGPESGEDIPHETISSLEAAFREHAK